jgi:branched-chain amino acid aminotransferase
MIALEMDFTDADLAAQIRDTRAAADMKGAEVYIRVLVTRGVGELTYDPHATPTPSVVIIVKPQVDPPPEAYERGVSAVIVDVVRNHPESVNPQIKSNNLLNCALAAQQAIRRGGYEGIMRNYRGELSECTTANLFVVRDGIAMTPPIEAGLLPGITREFLFEVGKEEGITVREEVLRDEDLFTADEAFLTSTTREVVPIVKVDERSIGNGRPGPITDRLLAGFRRNAWSS